MKQLNICILYLYLNFCQSQQSISDQDLNTRYYQIPARKNFTIPCVMYSQVDRFDAYSENSAFNFEVSFSGKRRQVCKEEFANQSYVLSLPKECKHLTVTKFSKSTVYKVLMYPESFDTKDILRWENFTFTEFVLHNTGDTDFFVRTFIKPESNAPISFFKGKSTSVKPDDNFTMAECGVNTKKPLLDEIVLGKPANPKSWPWMAALLKNDGKLLCGGVLITDRHVLTAAHCFLDLKINELKIRLGEYDFGTPNENTPPDFIIESYVEPNYSLDNKDNDIAIVKLERPTSFSEIISPICLPRRHTNYEGREGIVAGWGTQTEHGEVSSNVLTEILIPILLRDECEASYTENYITENMFCAGLQGRDSCGGDTGGPFMIQESDSRWYVVGIVSWGIGCGLPGKPGVYTKVNNYLGWINRNINT